MATKHEKESLGFTYDVFISFRGQDIRYTFIGYLREELSRRGICTFFDDWDLKLGKNISISLSNAIDEARILMVVFSENYASSTWCLDELIQILKCGSGYRKQIVFPIFYHVDPSDIRHQRKSYGEHMVTLEERFGKDSQKVKDWRSALRTACNLPGQHITTSSEKPEIDSIKEIVEKIYKNIDPKPLHAGKDLVGLEPRIKEVMSLLDMESDDVRMLGIHGLGGIGKTELAKALYNKIVQRFDAASFLENVREKSNKNGLEDLQKTLLSEMFEDLPHVLGSTSTGIAKIKNRLIQKKVLLVLDDVDDKDKLEKLAGERDWFGKGSRIIITTRDKDVLIAHEVKDMYEMKELDEQHSLELFCWNAFKQSEPKAGFEQVSLLAAGYAKRLPLALKVIGSDLASEETLDNWESVLKKYHDNRPNEKIHNVLKVSCDRLDPEHRQVFLDIACFFKGERKEYVENILDAKLSIKLLCNKSLLTIEGGSLKMHDLIQDMGRKIVEREATNPGKRSRLWYHRDVIRVLTDDLGNDEIQGIMLDPPQYERVDWSGTAFKKMNCLRILIVRNTYFSCEPKHLPNNLRVLDWENYPSESFPSKFYPEDIIVFNLPRSCLMLSEPFKGKKGIAGLEVLMPLKGKSVIPKWFDLVGNEGYPHFWVRGHANFPTFVLALVFHHGRGCSMFMPDEQLELHLFINDRYVPRKGYYTFQIPHNHVLICDLRLLFNHDEWLGLNAFLDRDWNVVQVLYETASSFTIRNWGVFAYEEETNRKNVQFTCPDPKYSHMLSVVPKNNPKKERIKMIQNFLADEVFDIMSGALSAMHESIKDSSAAVAFKELLGIQLETFKEVSRQAKAELESEGSIFEDKNSLLTDYLHHMNSVSEAYECNGRTEEQQQFTSLSLLHKYYCGMTDGLVEARKSFHSLNIIKTRNVVMNRAHKHVEWTIRVLPRALESYIEGVIDGLLEAKLSFPDLNVWEILDLVSIKGGFSMAVVRPLITLRDVDIGEEKRNDPPQQQQQQLVCSIFIEGMMDGLLEAHKSFPSLHIDNTINAALHKTYTVKSSPQGNELTLEMRMYTNGVINGLHEAKISFPDLDMRPILDTVLSRIGIYETPILQFASCILDAITIILQVGEALSSTLNRQKSKEEQQLVRWKIFCDGMTDGLVEARDNNFPLLDIIKTRSVAQNKIRRVQWLFVLPQEETKLYIEGIINGLLEAKLSFPYLDVWATLDRVLSRRGMEGLHERIRPFIRIMDEASTSGYWGIEQIVETIFDSGVLDVLFEAQNSFPSLDIIKISGSVFSALDNGNCIELLSDMNLVLPPTVEMIVYISGVVNGLHEAKLSFPDLDKYAILVSVLSKIGIDETLLLQYASRFRIHYGTMWK